MELSSLDIKKKHIYLSFDNTVDLWHQLIERIRSKGYRTGITGDDEDVEIVRFLLERIRTNKNRWTMPKIIQNAIDKYGKDTRQYVRKGDAARTAVVGAVRVTDDVKKKLTEMAKSKGIKLSDLVCQLLASSVA